MFPDLQQTAQTAALKFIKIPHIWVNTTCKTDSMGNNVTINTINNHIAIHDISPKFIHMYTSYVQRSL